MALTTVPSSLSATAITLTTAAQPNITSVGTLTGLALTGNATITKEGPTLTLTDSSSSRTLLNFVDDNNSVVRASGPLLLQSGGAVSALTLDASQNATFAGNVTAASGVLNVGIGTSAGGVATFFGTGTGAEAKVQIEGEGGADPYINFLANNTQHWSVGIDDSDSDKFKISKHSALGTNDYFALDTSGNLTLSGTLTGSTFTDGYVTWNLAQFNRYGAAIELQFTPTNSATLVKIGANGSNPTIFNAYTGAASFSGLVHLDGSGTAERLRISRGTDDSAQFTDFQYNHIELNRSNVALASAQTPLSILQRGSDGVRTVFHVHTDGKVGIGTTSPQRALQVGTYGTGNGEIAIAGSTNGYGSILFGDSASGAALYDGYLQYNHNDRELLLAAAAVVGAKINSNGDFGIGLLGGTSNPISARLDVVGGGTSTYPTLELVSNTSNTFNHAVNAFNASLTAGENNIIMIGRAGSTKNSGYIGYKWNGAGSDTNQLTFGHWAADNLMNLTANGNLGIGTETPRARLEVRGAANQGIILKPNAQIPYTPTSSTFYNGLTFENAGSGHAFSLGYGQGGWLKFSYFDNTSNYSELAQLRATGDFHPAGSVVMAQGEGINFAAQTDFATGESVKSSLLDDYEEGTFVPTIGGSTTQGSFSGGAANGGFYIKVGRMVQVWMNVNGTLSGAAGTMRVYGLPFTTASNIADHATNAVYSTGSLQYWSGSNQDVMGPLNYPSTRYLYFHTYNGSSTGASPTVNNSGHNLHCCAVYYTS